MEDKAFIEVKNPCPEVVKQVTSKTGCLQRSHDHGAPGKGEKMGCFQSIRPLVVWSGGEMVLGELSVPGSSTNLDYSRTRAYCTCSRCGWGLFGHFFSHLSFSLFFLPLSGRRPDID